jgi:hypothetical protein
MPLGHISAFPVLVMVKGGAVIIARVTGFTWEGGCCDCACYLKLVYL